MSAFWTFIQPLSSQFLRFSIFLGFHTMNLLLLLAHLLSGLYIGLLLLPLDPFFDLSGRAQGFSEHGSLLHLPGRMSLCQLWPLRCFLQGMLHLCTGPIASVGTYVSCVLVSGLLLPLLVY